MRREETDYDVKSKDRLLKILSKKFEKTFIGDLSEFEVVFGFLWGHGKRENELNDDELYYRDLWKEVRHNILNKGNGNIRAVHDELDQYTCTWNRYITILKGLNSEDGR
jgi:hypothetical protein